MSFFAGALREKRLAVTAEVVPPRSCDPEPVRSQGRLLKGWVTAVNVTDNHMGQARMSSLAGCLILHELGLEPVLQMTTRDRNLIGLQSDLLGAWSLGIRNVLIIRGDPPKPVEGRTTRGVWEVDTIQLLQLATDIHRSGCLADGTMITSDQVLNPPDFLVGAGANPFARPLDANVAVMVKKLEAGARFFQTQPVFEPALFKEWWEEVSGHGIPEKAPILVGLMPVRSAKTLRYLYHNVPGMSIPLAYIERLEKSSDPEREGLAIQAEIMSVIRELPGIGGFHFMPINWTEAVPELVKEAKLKP